jgi:hypothetical protein
LGVTVNVTCCVKPRTIEGACALPAEANMSAVVSDSESVKIRTRLTATPL